MQFTELLSNVPSPLKEAIHTFELEKGKFLLEQGSYPSYVYILIDGEVRAYHSSASGQEFLLGIFHRNELFGELEVQTKTPVFASVKCLEDSVFIRIPHEVYFELFRAVPEFAIHVNMQICRRNINASSRMVEHNFFPLEYHVVKYIVACTEDMKESSMRLNKKEVALFLGTCLRSLNRILKQLQDGRLIEIKKNVLYVLDKNQMNMILSKNFR